MPDETPAPDTSALDSPAFRGLFVESLEPERVTFTIETDDGEKDCWIDLLPMGDGDMDRYALMGVDYEAQTGGEFKVKSFDMQVRKTFLICRTVVAWCVWERLPKKPEKGDRSARREMTDWQESRLPENERDRIAQLAARRLTGPFAAWLVGQCERVNGLTPEQAKN